MAENPLLPDAELRALRLLLRRALDPSVGDTTPSRRTIPAPLRAQDSAALLAGTLLQLRFGDVAVAMPTDQVPAALLSGHRKPTASTPVFPEGVHRLQLAAGLAAGLHRLDSKGAVLALAQTGFPEPGWETALAWAQADRLPLILAIADPSGTDVFRDSTEADAEILTWKHVRKTSSRLQLPVLSVDGEDAVAVYRVMQESVLRARSGGGPAILWAALPAIASRRQRSNANAPALQRLESYMSTRRIRFH